MGNGTILRGTDGCTISRNQLHNKFSQLTNTWAETIAISATSSGKFLLWFMWSGNSFLAKPSIIHETLPHCVSIWLDPLTDIIYGLSLCRRLEADTKRELEDRIKDAQKRGNTKIDWELNLVTSIWHNLEYSALPIIRFKRGFVPNSGSMTARKYNYSWYVHVHNVHNVQIWNTVILFWHNCPSFRKWW